MSTEAPSLGPSFKATHLAHEAKRHLDQRVRVGAWWWYDRRDSHCFKRTSAVSEKGQGHLVLAGLLELCEEGFLRLRETAAQPARFVLVEQARPTRSIPAALDGRAWPSWVATQTHELRPHMCSKVNERIGAIDG